MSRLRHLLPFGIVAMAFALTGCSPELIPYASLSANGTVAPSADGTARPASTGASAAAAVTARVVRIDPSTTKITLRENEKVELDLTGSWMAYQPTKGVPQWVCPARTSAYFWTSSFDRDGLTGWEDNAQVK